MTEGTETESGNIVEIDDQTDRDDQLETAAAQEQTKAHDASPVQLPIKLGPVPWSDHDHCSHGGVEAAQCGSPKQLSHHLL